MSKRNNPIAMLAVLYGTAFVAAFNENVMNVALVDIMAQFSVDSVTSQWLVTGYMIVACCVTAAMSFISRRFTVRSVFYAASGIFLVGSVACYLAPSFPVLLAARLVQAVGTGIFIPTMMTSVMMVAPREKLGTFLAIGSCCITLGPAFGPVVSGVMVTMLGWRAIFLPGILIIAVLAVAAAKLLYNVVPAQDVRLDPASVVLLVVGLTAIVFGLTQLTTNLPVALACIVVGIVLLAVFGRRQLSIANPVMDVHPLLNPRFATACVLSVISMMTTFSLSVLMPLYFQGSLLYSALVSGALILVPIAINAVAAIVGGKVMDHAGEWPLLPVGFFIMTVGLVVVYLTGSAMDVVVVVAAASFVYAGVGLVMSPSQTAGLKTLSHDEAPHGVSIVNTFIMMAGSFGPSLFVGVMSSSAAAAVAGGSPAELAQAVGFSDAVLVAAFIALAGFIVSTVFSWTARKR